MIVIKNVSKKFHDDHYALMNISFSTEDRPNVVVGQSGSGKTTLLNIIAGLERDYEGEVFINGTERRELKNEVLKISYITKIPVLFSWRSVYKNLEYVFKVENKKFNRADARNKIKQVAEEFGLIGVLDKPVRKLAELEKKLVCLARAVLKNSSIIIVDEPFFKLTQFEISTLWQSMVLGMRKLSCDLVLADNGQNMACFDECNILKIEFGTKME